MLFVADDDMVEDVYADNLPGLSQSFGQLYVLFRGNSLLMLEHLRSIMHNMP